MQRPGCRNWLGRFEVHGQGGREGAPRVGRALRSGQLFLNISALSKDRKWEGELWARDRTQHFPQISTSSPSLQLLCGGGTIIAFTGAMAKEQPSAHVSW